MAWQTSFLENLLYGYKGIWETGETPRQKCNIAYWIFKAWNIVRRRFNRILSPIMLSCETNRHRIDYNKIRITEIFTCASTFWKLSICKYIYWYFYCLLSHIFKVSISNNLDRLMSYKVLRKLHRDIVGQQIVEKYETLMSNKYKIME